MMYVMVKMTGLGWCYAYVTINNKECSITKDRHHIIVYTAYWSKDIILSLCRMSVERNLGLIILVLSVISVMGQSNVFNKTTSVDLLVKPSRSISPLLQDPTLSLSSVQPLRTPSVSLSSVFTKQELQTSISNAATPSPSPSFSSTKTFLSRSSMSITPTRSIEISRILLTTVQPSTTLNSTVALSVSTVSSVKSISEMTVSLLQSKSYSLSSKIVSTTSTKYSFKLTVSDLIQETNTPTTTVSNCIINWW